MKILILKVLVSSFILLLFTGCWPCPEPEIIVRDKLVYIDKPIPEINKPPVQMSYNVDYIKFNNKTYYLISLGDGAIMMSNYDRYKIWSLNNYDILKELKRNYRIYKDDNKTKDK